MAKKKENTIIGVPLKVSAVEAAEKAGWLRKAKFSFTKLLGHENEDLLIGDISKPYTASYKDKEGKRIEFEAYSFKCKIGTKPFDASITTMLKWIVVADGVDVGNHAKGGYNYEDDLDGVTLQAWLEENSMDGDIFDVPMDWKFLGWATTASKVHTTRAGNPLPVLNFKKLEKWRDILIEANKVRRDIDPDAKLLSYLYEGLAEDTSQDLIGEPIKAPSRVKFTDPRNWQKAVPIIRLKKKA